MPRIALFQMNSGIDPDANLAAIHTAANDAAAEGASILFVPEMAVLLDRKRSRAASWIEGEGPDKALKELMETSAGSMIDLAIGSMPVAAENGLWANRSFYIDHTALEPVTYDKMHMFDVELASGESWRESAAYQPGERAVTVDHSPIGKLGLAICYDLRFPALFEELGRQSCDAIAIPAAFTVPTGQAHWHVMMRARAIEASAFVIAAAQVGEHEDGRETYGHSLVVDPWGEVLLDMGGERPGLGYCEIDLSRIEEVRRQLPSLANRREIPKSPLP